jgi:hypothetical protein
VPLFWPIPVGRRMWRMVGVPDGIAIRPGGPGEVFLLRGVFTVIAVLAVVAMFVPGVLPAIDLAAWADG